MAEFKDLTGKKIGRWTVVKRIGTKHKQALWLCICECKNTGEVITQLLNKGASKSCGCLAAELAKDRHRTHGMSNSPEHKSWQEAKQRCYNKNNHRYNRYGGRGIKICNEWLGEKGFENFLYHMGNRPEGTSLERVNLDGNYEPSNCIWANAKIQANNRSTNHEITFRGKTQNICEWAKEMKMNYHTLCARINNYGWSINQSLTIPVRKRR